MKRSTSTVQDQIAVRAQQAADKLSISLSEFNKWVEEGKIHKPYRIKKNVVLFDVGQLLHDWEMIKAGVTGGDEDGDDPWGDAIAKKYGVAR